MRVTCNVPQLEAQNFKQKFCWFHALDQFNNQYKGQQKDAGI